MAENTRSTSKFGQVVADVRAMQKPAELVDYIPAPLIEKIAYIMLLIWCLSPLIILFIKGAGLSSYLMAGLHWAFILWQLGMFGFLLGIVALSKSLLAARRAAAPGDGGGTEPQAQSPWLWPWLRSHSVPALLALLLLWSTISCFCSSNIPQSFLGRQYVRDGLFTYYAYAGIFLCAYIVRRRRYARILMEAMVAVAALLAFFTALDLNVINYFFVMENDCSVFYNINHYGYYLCLNIMVAAMLAVTPLPERDAATEPPAGGVRSPRLLLLLRLAVVALLTQAMMINYSFGPALAVMGGMALLVIFSACFDRQSLKRALAVVIVFIVVMVGYNAINGNLSGNFAVLFGDVSKIVQDDPEAGDAGSKRWVLWVHAVQFAQEKPLFGYGPENTEDRYAQEDIVMGRPHCIPLQLAISQGIPAMLFYLLALGALTVNFFRRRHRLNSYEIGMFCAVAAWFASSLLGVSMYYTSPFYFTVLGLTAAALEERG